MSFIKLVAYIPCRQILILSLTNQIQASASGRVQLQRFALFLSWDNQIGYAGLDPLGQSIDRIHSTDKVYIGWNRKWDATAR